MITTKEKKQEIIKILKEKISTSKIMMFVDFTGISADHLFKLRRKLSDNSFYFKVAKKTLIQKALKDNNFSVDVKNLKGEIGLVFGQDEVEPAKITYQFSKENNTFKILGGILDNNFIESNIIINLAQLPSRSELLTNLYYNLSNPLRRLINVLESNLQQFVYILSQRKIKV